MAWSLILVTHISVNCKKQKRWFYQKQMLQRNKFLVKQIFLMPKLTYLFQKNTDLNKSHVITWKITNHSGILQNTYGWLKVHSYYTAIALRYRIAPYCTVIAMLPHYGNTLMLNTFQLEIQWCWSDLRQNVIDTSALQRNCGVVWTDLYTSKTQAAQHAFCDIFETLARCRIYWKIDITMLTQ